jgi:hypothetical protein
MLAGSELVGATVLGRYRIVACLAQGGMGVVYLARAQGAAGFAKPVVVKRVLPNLAGDDRLARLFVREARILANLQHPNIVGVTDFGEEDGAYIMVLDYVRAYDLGRWCAFREGRSEKFPVDAALHIMIKVLDALEYAHTLALPDGTPLDIVHADVSPANILVDSDGQVKLLDFGIARMAGEVTHSTDSSSVRGKFSYLPIEALDGSAPRMSTDVYACGVVLYEILSGTNPFMGTDDTRTLAKVISHEPPPVSQLRSGITAELDAILARAMAKDRSKRFATAKDFARELRRVQLAPEDEAARALGAIAKIDYVAMPSPAGKALADLEEAWRNPPAAIENAPGPRAAKKEPGAHTTALPRQRSRLLIAAAVVAGLVLIAGVPAGIALFFSSRGEAVDRKFVVIEHNAGGTITSASASAPASALTRPDSSVDAHARDAVVARPNKPDKPEKPAPGPDPLSAALAKNQPDIEACFRDKGANVSGSPEVSLRLTIDRAGAVQRASILPAELTDLPLGQCILGVAKRTPFPADVGPATFRIPLRARKVP